MASFSLQLPPPWQYEMKHADSSSTNAFDAFLDPAAFDDDDEDGAQYHTHRVGPLGLGSAPSIASASSPSSRSDSASSTSSSSSTLDLISMPSSMKVMPDGTSSSVILPVTAFPYPRMNVTNAPHSATYILPGWVPSAAASSSSQPTLGSLSGQRAFPTASEPVPFAGGKVRSHSMTSKARRNMSSSPPRSRSASTSLDEHQQQQRREEKLGWLQRLQQAENDAQRVKGSPRLPSPATSSPRLKSFSLQGITFP